MRLQWLAKEIGFEKLMLKNKTLRGFFIANQQSLYYESDQFTKVLSYVQTHQRESRLKEGKNALSITFDNVQNIEQAISILTELVGVEVS
ncbi:hypothetical protein D3C78_1534890 [compost metagenome]